MQSRRDGSRSLGLSTKVLPQRDGDRVHPHRHHGREVERRDAGAHAERLAEGEDVDAGGDLVGVVALEQLRDAAGELDHLEAALHLAARRRRAPCRARRRSASASSSTLRVHQLPEREQDLGARATATTAHHDSNAAFAALRRPRRRRRRSPARTSACCSPVAGFQTGLVRVDGPGGGLAADPVLDGPQRTSSFSSVVVNGRRESISWSSHRCADPGVCRVVADLPDPLGVRARHDVEVVEVVAGCGHRRAVPAVGDEDGVARRTSAQTSISLPGPELYTRW